MTTGNIAERIEYLLKYKGLKKVEFAKMLKIDSSHVTKIVSGVSNPSSRLLEAICEKFSINPDWLFYGSGSIEIEKTEDEKLVEWIARLTNKGMEHSIAKRFAVALSQMNDNELEAVAKFAEKIFGEIKK